ncbi:MAG: hypothetical protein RLN60_01605 [Phycisphaerales bacterium]
MKFDWAMQISIVLGIVVMVATAFTFDHTAAERRETLAAIGERFEAGEYIDFNLWRPLADNVLLAPAPERELAKFARKAAPNAALDEPAITGIAWYWIALRELSNNTLAQDVAAARYERALGRAIEHLEQSAAKDSRDPGVRYMWGHYAGRAAARLEDADRAARALPVALDAAPVIADSTDPFIAYRHIETLGNSYARVGDDDGMRAAWAIAIRIQIDRLDLNFDARSLHNEILRQLDSEDQTETVRALLADAMERWLDEHGESYRRGRSYLHLGWLYNRLGDTENAERAWRKANAWWEANMADADEPYDSYNLACTRALIGETEAALDALARAIEQGFTDMLTMHQNPDLASVRETDRFKAIDARAAELRDLRAAMVDDEGRLIE